MSLQGFVLALTVLFAVGDAATIRAGCTININGGLPSPQPLVLKIGGTNDGYGFHLPSSSGIVDFAVNAQAQLSCTGTSNYFTTFGSGTNLVTATCVDGTTWSVSGTQYTFSTLSCVSNPSHVALRSGSSCYGGAALVDIGFQVDTRFIKTLEICFNDDDLNTLWSKFDLVHNIGGFQTGFPSPSFVASTFYPGLSPDTQYTKVTQHETVARLLGSTALADQYVSMTTDYFMARGHLTAKADFVYGSQHRATYYFINVAPQWQTFNGGNWNTLEDNVRTMASARSLDLEVYTGTHGIMTLPNTAGVATPIYLYKDANNNDQIPVPAVYWKVVYNPANRQGVALIGVNNPYLTKAELGSDYLLCTDVSSQIAWVKWALDDQKKGFGYACNVDDLRQKVPSMPSLTVSGLLV